MWDSSTLINGVNDTNDSKAVSIKELCVESNSPLVTHVELYGGAYDSFIFNGDFADVAIYGGSFGEIKSEYNTSIAVGTLLAKNRAFVRTLPAELIDGSAVTLYDGLTNVSVVEHEHRYNVETGKCPCGVCALAVFTETTQSTVTYTFIESATQFKDIAENEADGVLKLTSNVDCGVVTLTINGNKTIDMNGHTLNVSYGTETNAFLSVYGNVTFENSGSDRATINGEGVYSCGMTTVNGDIKFNRFSTVQNGDAVINAGVFESIKVQSGRSVSEILGSSKALASESTGDILNASNNEVNITNDNIIVIDHPKHTYDDNGNCACGYKCLHDGEGQVDEDNTNIVCSECGAKIYAKVTVTGGDVRYFDDVAEGLLYADKAENKGCVFTLMTNGELKSDVTLSSGQFTIATTNSYTLNPIGRKITIDGADVIAEGYMGIRCMVYVESGSLTLPDGSGTGFNTISISGGTVTISEDVNADSNVGADNLNVVEDATDVKLTIGGGTYCYISLGQLKLKDVIASGVRVISYDQPTDPTAEKTPTALLYSDIAEESTFDNNDKTVSYYLFIKCDHKNDDGSFAFNEGGNICKYCNTEFAASVSYTTDDGETTELFSDIFDAFDKANEVGTATVTLQKNITGTLSRAIESTGENITLDLNGKKITANYDGVYAVDVKGGKLTIIGEGQSALNYVTVYDGADAEIQGGVYTSLTVKDGGNAELKGGRFGGVSVSGEGRTLEDLLADGYGYMNFLDVAWVTVANREKQTIANVTIKEAPIKSASISVADGSPMTLYRNGTLSANILVTKELSGATNTFSYTDYANGNEVNSAMLLFSNYYLSGSDLDQALAEDGEVEYYCIFKCNGYEYKTNSLKFTLATCLHENLKNNNGVVTCDTCGFRLIAQIKTADGEVTNYDSITNAVAAAAENEGSTLTLVSRDQTGDTVTISGGKFTVDLAGVSALYKFNITGGDITFKSSEEFSSDYSDRCDITVNGSDAKVAIDGKIELETVQAFDGTLTINGTEAYIEGLSIVGGKSDIDGAQIDTLATYYGEAVIKNVTVESLIMYANPTEESEYNISIVSGSFDKVAIADTSGYNVGKVIASGSRVRSKDGLLMSYESAMDYYSGNNLVYEICDHKDAYGAPNLDDDGVCIYCNTEIAATVTYTAADGSEKTDLFGDICDAFDKANDAGTATVTLCSDIDGTLTQEIKVSGNDITLDLNGKILRRGEGLGYTIHVLNNYGSGRTLTVNGDGSIGSVGVGSAVKIIVNGGNFEYLNVSSKSEAEISGGRFDQLSATGDECDSLLAYGYAYKNTDDGTWLSIAERKASRLYNVTVAEAPIKSASIAWADDESPVVYRNGGEDYNVVVTREMASSPYANIEYTDYAGGNKITHSSLIKGAKSYSLDIYGIGSAVTEDKEVEYYVILASSDGYEYKTNTLKFTLATCQHESVTKNDDGTLTCDKCKAYIYASVETVDGKKTYHEDLSAAISKAEENDGSVLILLNSTVSGPYEINKGSFTVDFNGKTALGGTQYFNINGGNIAFKSTEAQESSNKFTVNVLGENAVVTVGDGVYLQELIVESGKVTVEDNAIIDDSFAVYGGETVIRATGTLKGLGNLTLKASETEYSVSIESGYFDSVKCEDDSGYTLGKAIAKGTTVKNDAGRSYEYSDIFDSTGISSTVIIEKCKHIKNGMSNNIALGSSGRCIYCNNEYAATVNYIGDGGLETVDLFENILDAFDKANEVGTATVKLYKDIKESDFINNEDSDLIRNIIVKGDVTLELNGKNLGDTLSSSRIYIYNGGALTVNGDGRIPVRIYANSGSKITVNSGYCDYIIADGNVIVRGGTIDLLNIYSEAEISGGTFKFLTINNGGTLESVLADGNAYYNVDDESWLTVAEREETAINGKNVTVKEAPIKSARIAWRNGESPVVYRNGIQSVTVDVAKELAGDSQVIYSDFVNGIELTADSLLEVDFTTISGADVEACGIPDGEVEYYCIFTCDGYEYKSNVLEFTLATCLHEKLTNVGGIVTCDACGFCLIAQVETADGEVTYYDGIATALAAAAENEGSTLTLVSRIQVGVSVPISGGKFTVDLAGVPAKYKFNITGGDITFKSSEEFSSDYSDRCDITVNGSDAKVTIDGKIELETVELSGGTFTTNNTEADINELLINDGKADIDGAYIRTITINGGDTVIKDVVANSLDMNRYSNISIVSGRFHIVTFNVYTLGRAIASGSRVIGHDMSGAILYKYADIQSMTEDSDIIVIKCDHKDKYGNAAVSNNACLYCNSQIVATVTYATADGNVYTDLFADICDAFDKANEKESATVTLLRDRSAGLTRAIDVTGNVTLELNGHNLMAGYNMRTITVDDGGKLTVNGGDSDRLYIVIGLSGSKIIVNGGSLSNLRVEGDAELTGGSFSDLSCAEGITVDSLLAPGYAYKKSTSGTWVSIADRENTSLSSVTVTEAPIKSATLDAGTNKLYRNSNADLTLKFNLTLAIGTNLNDSDARMRYGINSYESGDIVYIDLRTLLQNTQLLASKILEKAGDSNVAEVYFIVTYDGYEVKSNTVCIDLVDCKHSQVVDPTTDENSGGNIEKTTYCEICESQFHAKIVNGDSVKYYNDLYEAAADAQKSENEGCVLYPLYNAKAYEEQIVISGGKFTLRQLTRIKFDKPVIIKGDVDLTLSGRSLLSNVEDQIAIIVESGNVDFDSITTHGVIINGGNVTMGGSNIGKLTINDGSVSITSGQFYQINVTADGKVIADYVAPDFWLQDGETKEWIDIFALKSVTATSDFRGMSVRMCPMSITQPEDTVYYTNGYYPNGIPSLEVDAMALYTAEVNPAIAYQWFSVDENGNETEIEGATDNILSLENLTTGKYYCRLTYSNATTEGISVKSDIVTATITECKHTGGEADCTNKAVCEICNAEYGEPLGHNYVVINVVEPDYLNEGYSVFECSRCSDTYIGAYVPVKPIPNVTGIRLEKTAYDEAIVSWDAIDGVDGYYVECYVGGQWTPIDYEIAVDGIFSRITGLSAGLTYKVRIMAYAGSARGNYEYVYVDTVPSPVWEIKTLTATDSSVRVSWNRNTRADGYRVEWYINNEWSVKDISGNENVAATIDGLEAGSQYKVRVSAYRGELLSPYTYGYINTLPSEVTGITQTATTSTITLTWDKNNSADGYIVEYYANSKWNVKTLTGKDETTVTIGGLRGYSTYKMRIKAYKGELVSEYSDIYVNTAPTQVSGLKVKSAVDSKAVVTWSADSNAEGYTVEYYIGGKWVQRILTDRNTTTAELDGLTPYSTYKVRVRAYKGELYGDYSYITVATVLSSVTGIKTVSASKTSVTVAWDKNNSADGYKAEIYTGGKWVEKTVKGSANAAVTIGGLKAGSVYKVRIASYKGANTSAYTYTNVTTAK